MIHKSQHGEYQVATKPAVIGFVAWAKRGPILADCPVNERGDCVWYEFGETREEAKKRILAKMGLSHDG